MRFRVLAVVLALAIPALSHASSYIVPTTTLAAQTGNNTSAANSFLNQSNGNRGAGNVSKLDIHSLLYPGASTKVYAHLLLWFGEPSHMNNGYSSTDPAQIARQVQDMISRGIDGVIIDWYGPNNAIDQATQLVMTEAEKHPGFSFAIMIDVGAIQWNSCAGCSPQQALTEQMQYIEQTYFPSPAYMTENGQPVVTNFNVDIPYSIDWNGVTAALSRKPFYLFQNNSGFSHALANGSYSWVMPTTSDYGMSYLSSFYDTGMSFAGEQTVGATYKGFNDTLASWGSNRIMGQQCGQTWLQTFSEINSLYNSGKPLPVLQLVTWNDYEEATEIESGIDNCFSVAAAANSNSLQWSIQGKENTVDHYTVYISSDGQNLMPLADLAAGIYSLNLCSFPVPGGSYQLFVQAVGKPSLANQMSGSVSYSPRCSTGGQPPTISLSASPSSLSIAAGQSGRLTITATPQAGAFNNPISLSCAGLPVAWSCSFSPATLTPGSNAAQSALTIAAVPVGTARSSRRRSSTPNVSYAFGSYAFWLLPFGIAGFAFTGNRRGGSNLRVLAAGTILAVALIAASCGGMKTAVTPADPANFTVTVSGISGSSQFSTTINVAVE